MNRYRLRLTDGTEVIFEARPGDVVHQESGIRVWESTRKSRFFPYVSVLEESCERVEWRAVEPDPAVTLGYARDITNALAERERAS